MLWGCSTSFIFEVKNVSILLVHISFPICLNCCRLFWFVSLFSDLLFCFHFCYVFHFVIFCFALLSLRRCYLLVLFKFFPLTFLHLLLQPLQIMFKICWALIASPISYYSTFLSRYDFKLWLKIALLLHNQRQPWYNW